MRLRLSQIVLETWERGSLFAGADASFGTDLGLTRLGASYNLVPPGKSGCPFHNHWAEDELFIVLSGSGTYRFGGEEVRFSAGDVLGAPAGGADTAHQVLNTGQEPLVYLVVSNKADTDVVEYPDSGKVMLKAAADARRSLLHRTAAADYWDGEPSAL